MIDYKNELNDEQYEVVVSEGGPTMILAGAGSGKTRTMVYRVAYLIEQGVQPENILLVTFTKKAAGKMLGRVQELCDADMSELWGGTFHHIGCTFLRKHGHLIGYNKNFTILDEQDADKLMETCAKELGLHEKHEKFPKGSVIRNIMSYAVNTDRQFGEAVSLKYEHLISSLPSLEKVVEEYIGRKKDSHLMDFDDLLLGWKLLLQDFPDLRDAYADQFQYILVDEYQDTNSLQADIIDFLAAKHRNLTVVGDDYQSIYAFRGADFSNMLQFSKRYPDVKTYTLGTNYRSTPEIVSMASRSIGHNVMQFNKVLKSARKNGQRPRVVSVMDVNSQSRFIAKKIHAELAKGTPPTEIAVLYRAHFHAMELQMELKRQGIPFVVRSGMSFFEYAHVKDMIAFLKVLANPLDSPSWKRIVELQKGAGAGASRKIWDYLSSWGDPLAATQNPEFLKIAKGKAAKSLVQIQGIFRHLNTTTCREFPSEAIETVLQCGYKDHLKLTYDNYPDRLDGILRLQEYAMGFNSVGEMLTDLALMSSGEGDKKDKNEGKVVLSTIHQSKGLEWGVVFIICVCEDMFPFYKALQEEGGEEEERRLFYVATTRAKNDLYLISPMQFYIRGEVKEVEPSRFLNELNQEEEESPFSYDNAQTG